jgi:hypothetical protein
LSVVQGRPLAQPGGEDSTSINAHITAMQDEMAKEVPDWNVIEDRMIRTLDHRRKTTSSTTLEELLKLYPTLRIDIQVIIVVMVLISLN